MISLLRCLTATDGTLHVDGGFKSYDERQASEDDEAPRSKELPFSPISEPSSVAGMTETASSSPSSAYSELVGPPRSATREGEFPLRANFRGPSWSYDNEDDRATPRCIQKGKGKPDAVLDPNVPWYGV